MKEPLTRSEVESNRFNLSVARAVCAEDFSAKEIVEQIFRERIDVAILRIPASRTTEAIAFERLGIV